jgi:hypothetical protein
LHSKPQSKRDHYEAILGVCGHQRDSLYVFEAWYTGADQQICKVIAQSRLKQSVDWRTEAFFGSAANADHRIEKESTPRRD